MKASRVLDVPVGERRCAAGKSAAGSPRRSLEVLNGLKLPDELPGKASKLQLNGDRTVNRHRWAS